MEFSCTLPLEPVAWGRVKRGAHGQAYVPTKTRQFKRDVELMIHRRFLQAPWTGPIGLDVKFYSTRPKSVTRIFPHVKPDLDNYIKAVLDAANGILWKDDGQIVSLMARKLYATIPAIEIRVFTL